MADGEACVSEMTVVFQTENVTSPGSKSHDDVNPSEEKEGRNGEDDYAGLQQSRKKRRLTLNQVEYLEKKFEVENKLEPERKLELAKSLGLQPRQVAIWFQNRRARLKTKRLDKDYGELKCIYDKLMSDYDNLLKENDDLKMKIDEVKEELLERENKTRENDGDEKLEATAFPVEWHQSPFLVSDSKQACNLTMAASKQEEASSGKSEVFDSESSFNAENHSSLMEVEANTSSLSEFSQDEEDDFNKTLLPSFFPNLEKDEELSESCCHGFPGNDEGLCFWSYFSSEI